MYASTEEVVIFFTKGGIGLADGGLGWALQDRVA